MDTLGFIGLGNMGTAILNGILEKKLVPCENIYVSRKHPEKADALARQGIHVCQENIETVRQARIIILAVKPNLIEEVLGEVREALSNQTVISIAAGWSPQRLGAALPESVHYICAMPNVAVSVLQGCTILNEQGRYTEEDLQTAETIFGAIGSTHLVGEKIYSACGTLSGCGPAYVFEMIEALCDASVLAGIPKPLATALAAEMVSGAAQMVLATGEHPSALKDRVCSPGGTTIEGIRALHEHGFHAAVMSAISSAIEKGNRL